MKKTFIIPKRIELGGTGFEISYDERLAGHRGHSGEARLMQSKIVLMPDTPENPRSRDYLAHTYFHELAHCILDAMGEVELCGNEKFVDLLGRFMHQARVSEEHY